jgi:hypothetical protein
MTFGPEPPKNVNNLFRSWLKGIPKKDLNQIRVGVCAIIWAIWNPRNDFIFNKQKNTHFTGYSYGYPQDPYGVLSPTRGAAGGNRFWVQLFGDGSSGFIQPMRLTVAQ